MIPTKRQTLGNVFICLGCCCGRTDKGKPPVPVDWLKAEWKTRRLLKHVHLTIGGCLGPCELVNVVAIASPGEIRYYGRFETQVQFEMLLEWATASAAAGRLLPTPPSMAALEIDRFREGAATSLAACAS
jgi:cobaltochelatase CobN